MDAQTLCRSLLLLADAIPSDVAWHVTPTDNPRWLFIADGRPDASTIELAAIAGQFGEVITEHCHHSRRDSEPTIGCVLEIATGSDPDDTADRLRAAYHVATVRASDDSDGNGPF